MRRADPLGITRALTLTDNSLAAAGLDRGERLELWRAFVRALQGASADLGLGAWLTPGVHLELHSTQHGLVQAELGWPDLPPGSATLRLPLRRFGSPSWDLDGGSWAPGWWGRVHRRLPDAEWDQAEDEQRVSEDIEGTFDLIWMNDLWERWGWHQATPGWVDRVFAANHAAMKRGLLAAFEVARRGDPIFHVPVLAGGATLQTATLKTLKQPRTTLFSPSEAGYRAFVENVRAQGVPRHQAQSMAFTWWRRIFDDEGTP